MQNEEAKEKPIVLVNKHRASQKIIGMECSSSEEVSDIDISEMIEEGEEYEGED
jgi:hypothetical protein